MRFKIEPGLITKVLRSTTLAEPPTPNPFVPDGDGVRLAYDTIVIDLRLGVIVLKKGGHPVGSVEITEVGKGLSEITLEGLEGTMAVSFD